MSFSKPVYPDAPHFLTPGFCGGLSGKPRLRVIDTEPGGGGTEYALGLATQTGFPSG